MLKINGLPSPPDTFALHLTLIKLIALTPIPHSLNDDSQGTSWQTRVRLSLNTCQKGIHPSSVSEPAITAHSSCQSGPAVSRSSNPVAVDLHYNRLYLPAPVNNSPAQTCLAESCQSYNSSPYGGQSLENRLNSLFGPFLTAFCCQSDLAPLRPSTAILLLANLRSSFILQLPTGKQVRTSLGGGICIFSSHVSKELYD